LHIKFRFYNMHSAIGNSTRPTAAMKHSSCSRAVINKPASIVCKAANSGQPAPLVSRKHALASILALISAAPSLGAIAFADEQDAAPSVQVCALHCALHLARLCPAHADISDHAAVQTNNSPLTNYSPTCRLPLRPQAPSQKPSPTRP
jgi:hypothetical protein